MLMSRKRKKVLCTNCEICKHVKVLQKKNVLQQNASGGHLKWQQTYTDAALGRGKSKEIAMR